MLRREDWPNIADSRLADVWAAGGGDPDPGNDPEYWRNVDHEIDCARDAMIWEDDGGEPD